MSEKRNTEIVTIEDWVDLTLKINEFANFPQYIYRGHRNEEWLLESTLSRVLKDKDVENKDLLVEEHLHKFKLSIRGRRGPNPSKLTENELWALGQHFGLHTPLLDWSQSPYVALFFAFSSIKKSNSEYRSLWILNSYDINTINNSYENDDKENVVELINPILDENIRLVNQNGLFTKLAINTDIEKWVSGCKNSIDWLTLSKLRISENLRDEILIQLDLMNINYSSLFPDLIGSSLHSNMQLEQLDYLKNERQKIWNDYNKK